MPGDLPTGRVRRLTAPARLGVGAATAQAAAWVRDRTRRASDGDTAQAKQLVRTAEQAAALMGEMKGAVMKLGQLLSFADVSALPPEFRTVLAHLQADAPPMAWELVERVVTEDLGQPPEEAFERFSRPPIAAASIGQVHSARLRDGTDVVVKVQYPGVAEAIDADLRNTAMLSAVATMAQTAARPLMPRSDIRALVAEIRDRVQEELDYEREAANQAEFADLWRGHPTIRVPEVVPELSTRRVLTQHYHDGMRWSAALGQSGEMRDAWGEAIYRFVFTSLYQHHVFNADPHPGNYLFHDDGTVTFLDFGCVRRFTPEQVGEIRRVGEAILAGDAQLLVDRLVEAGVLRTADDVDPERQLEFSSYEWAPILSEQPFTYTQEWAEEAVRRITGMAPEYLTMVTRLSLPPHWLFLGRITLGVGSVLTGLRATADWRRLLLDEIWAD